MIEVNLITIVLFLIVLHSVVKSAVKSGMEEYEAEKANLTEEAADMG